VLTCVFQGQWTVARDEGAADPLRRAGKPERPSSGRYKGKPGLPTLSL
jgi:hypothetical protein